MRIIGGKLRGIRLNPPHNLPVRPTTDLAKEALFNILGQYIDLEEAACLDLCSGTGNISLELASRGALSVDSVDIHYKCLAYQREVQQKHGLNNIHVQRSDIFKFISGCTKQYDFIFTDPPYDLEGLPQLASLIFERNMINEGGLLVIEHPSTRKMHEHPNFVELRKYGYSSFSFYQN